MKFFCLTLFIFLSGKGFSQCIDCDGDTIQDSLEQVLAEKFAPIIFHDINETNLPTNVDTFLQHTSLYFVDKKCNISAGGMQKLIVNKPNQVALISQTFGSDFCTSDSSVKSNCTRSVGKQRTFYLRDVDIDFKRGSIDTKDWTTYFHSYKNVQGGITIQYWYFYSFNTGYQKGPFDFSHGGDWEGVQVVLDSAYLPMFVDFLGHQNIIRFVWDKLKRGGGAISNKSDSTHVMVFSEKGSHTSVPYKKQSGFLHQSWSGGLVKRENVETQSGKLINLGEKLHPINGQDFIQYSGLWGSPGKFYFTSGYWAPPYNETGMKTNTNFITAWCNDMLDAGSKAEGGLKECFPCSVSR